LKYPRPPAQDSQYSESSLFRGTLAATTIYVRLNPVAIADYNGIITNIGGGAPEVDVTVSGFGRDSSAFITKAIYVSPDGNDVTGTGKIDNPYKSIYKAGLKLTNDYSLVLRGGTYMQDSLILRDINLTNIALWHIPANTRLSTELPAMIAWLFIVTIVSFTE